MRLDSVASAASSYLIFLLTILLLIPVMTSILGGEALAELTSLTIAAVISGIIGALLVEKPLLSLVSVLVGGFLSVATLILLPLTTSIFPQVSFSWFYAPVSVLGGALIALAVAMFQMKPAPSTIAEKPEEPKEPEKPVEEKVAVEEAEEVVEEPAEKKEEKLEAVEKAIEETLRVVKLEPAKEAEEAVEKELEELEKLIKGEANLKKCPHCGQMIPADSIYCPLCGKKVEQAGK